MKSLVRQLRRWQFRVRLIRLGWGLARWVVVVAAVLAVCCFTDWVWDRYADTPKLLRVAMTAGQLALAGVLALWLVVRPWFTAPPIVDLALRAEKEIPEFGHRLVTALQLNRPGARTEGMSPYLIQEVTREAGEMAARHDLLRLVDYQPLHRAAFVLAPVLFAVAGFVALKPDLAFALLKRQALLGADIPRSVWLENATQPVWPNGAEVLIRVKVGGRVDPEREGTVYVTPKGQPTDKYPLAFRSWNEDGTALYESKLPPSSAAFTFTARVADGRMRQRGSVEFEPSPAVEAIEAWLLLPEYLGTQPNKRRYTREQARGEVVDALPRSDIRVWASFNKPVVKALLIPIERGTGNTEADRPPVSAVELNFDRQQAVWVFPTSPRLIAYRIELEDDRGFRSTAQARRGVRMLPDQPPAVEIKPESFRDPDPATYSGKVRPEDFIFDLPLSLKRPEDRQPGDRDGQVMVTYLTRSQMGVSRVNLRYRVVPRANPGDANPEQRVVNHPSEDPTGDVFFRLPLNPVTPVLESGPFVPDLGLFQKSGAEGQVDCYIFPSPDPRTEPGELAAGGRYNLEVSKLKYRLPDGKLAEPKIGDTVEIYVEVYDKVPDPDRKRPAGYSGRPIRKTIVTEEEAARQLLARDEIRARLAEYEKGQQGVFKPQK
jgi:hypothetical protein